MGLAYSFAPMDEINKYIWPIEEQIEEFSYDQAIEKNKFEVTYG